MTENDQKFEEFVDGMMSQGLYLSQVLTSDIVDLSLILDTELQCRVGVDINEQHGRELMGTRQEYQTWFNFGEDDA